MTTNEVARICHEANKAYCETLNDLSQQPWDDAPEEIRNSAILGVEFHLENPDATPAASHISWYAQKEADGWVYGETKDFAAKTHPCMVPYEKLPEAQQVKDYLFKAVVDGLRKFIQ